MHIHVQHIYCCHQEVTLTLNSNSHIPISSCICRSQWLLMINGWCVYLIAKKVAEKKDTRILKLHKLQVPAKWRCRSQLQLIYIPLSRKSFCSKLILEWHMYFKFGSNGTVFFIPHTKDGSFPRYFKITWTIEYYHAKEMAYCRWQ